MNVIGREASENYRYVMQITGDNAVGKRELMNFADVGSQFPVIATTSDLLTTGVNCKTCKVIVIDKNIGSLSEFKQILGRGTRLYPKMDKMFFTLLDFRDASRLFADPDFMGSRFRCMRVMVFRVRCGAGVVMRWCREIGFGGIG